MYFSKSSFSCFRFILWGTTATEAREELEELDEEERDLRRKICTYYLLKRELVQCMVKILTLVLGGTGDC